MSKRSLWWAGLVLLGAGPPSYADFIWSDGFEGGLLAWTGASGNWAAQTSALSARSGSRGANIQGNTNGNNVLSLYLSSAGFQDLALEWWYKIRDPLEGLDIVTVEWTAGGGLWETIDTYTEKDTIAGQWQFVSVPLPSTASNNPDFGFRFVANLGSSSDRMNFDDVAISGRPVPAIPAPQAAVLGLWGLLCLPWRRLSWRLSS